MKNTIKLYLPSLDVRDVLHIVALLAGINSPNSSGCPFATNTQVAVTHNNLSLDMLPFRASVICDVDKRRLISSHGSTSAIRSKHVRRSLDLTHTENGVRNLMKGMQLRAQ
jgi:hypothetical protein